MNYNTNRLCPVLIALLLACTALPAGEEKPEKEVRLTLSLQDGSRLVGTPAVTTWSLQSSLGLLIIKQELVKQISFKEEMARLHFRNGDILSGTLRAKTCQLKTLVGNVTVTIKHVTGITVNVYHKGGTLEDYIVRGENGAAGQTAFVKGLPPELAKKYKTVTKSINTYNLAIVARQNHAPWLYFGPHGESPRILHEEGQTLYPLWGTWRQDRAGGWVWYDENGTRIKGTTNTRIPHKSSAVDYLVVPDKKTGQKTAPDDGIF